MSFEEEELCLSKRKSCIFRRGRVVSFEEEELYRSKRKSCVFRRGRVVSFKEESCVVRSRILVASSCVLEEE